MSEIIVDTKRVFDAPREAVWEAFADPKRLAQWWGPNGFTNKTELFWHGVIQTDTTAGGAKS